ncbi:hypothetical protein LCGC14_1819630, partial [marine sediment metagenome]
PDTPGTLLAAPIHKPLMTKKNLSLKDLVLYMKKNLFFRSGTLKDKNKRKTNDSG